MRICSTILSCLLLFSNQLFSNHHYTLQVRSTDTSSLYLSQLLIKNTAISKDYLQKLRQIVIDDFTYGGFSEIKPLDLDYEKILSSFPRTLSIPKAKHTLVLFVDHDSLSVSCYLPNGEKAAQEFKISLSQNLFTDAFALHEMTDALHLLLYHTEGIASKKIIYAQTDPQDPNISEIYVKYFDGLPGQKLTHDKSLALDPIFTPQGSLIYTSYKQGQPKLFKMDPNRTRSTPLVSLKGNQILPAISPLGTFIAFISDAAGKPDLFLQQLSKDGSSIGPARQIYSHPSATQASSTFSPDGSKIAFVSDQSGTPKIYVLDLCDVLKSRRNPSIRVITTNTNENTSPSWSPDGTKIAYSAMTNNTRQIWVYDVESNEHFQITFGEGHKENPVWAQNSFHILYNSTSPDYNLFVTYPNQKHSIQISHGSEIKHYPHWEHVNKRKS